MVKHNVANHRYRPTCHMCMPCPFAQPPRQILEGCGQCPVHLQSCYMYLVQLVDSSLNIGVYWATDEKCLFRIKVYTILAVKNMTTWQFITMPHFTRLVPLHNPPCEVLELGKNVLYISRPCSTLVVSSGGIVIPPDDGWDSGLVSLSVLNHCEGGVVGLSIVFDNNVPISVLGPILFCLELKV